VLGGLKKKKGTLKMAFKPKTDLFKLSTVAPALEFRREEDTFILSRVFTVRGEAII
jgi:hypothetical protein